MTGRFASSAEALGDRLKHLMSENGTRTSDLATHLNCVPSAIGNWLSGRKRPCIEYAEMICSFFSVDLDYLYLGKLDKVPQSNNNECFGGATDERILQMLIAIQGDLSDLRTDMLGMRGRLGVLEAQNSSLSSGLDQLEKRLQRIDARLNLIDA